MQDAPDHPGDTVQVGKHLDVAEAHGAHDTQHRVGLTDAHLEVQPSAGTQGQITDMAIHLKRLEVIKKRLNAILADNTGRSVEEITAACERDNFMTAEEAVAYGLIDKVIDKR